jgi:hypothetical protein
MFPSGVDGAQRDVYVGIDVAFAKRKRLPVALCTWNKGKLLPLPVAVRGTPPPPLGRGNVAAIDPDQVAQFAEETADYLHKIERHFGVSICRVAIDAPSDPRPEDLSRRRAEYALDQQRISCFTTPSSIDLQVIRDRVRRHLQAGGTESTLPHANQLWMFAGFALFERLRKEWECMEVFPQAIAHALGANAIHKSKPEGMTAQLTAVARATGWPVPALSTSLKGIVWGPAHDGLDAYLSAWIAALGKDRCTALGSPPDDAIWIPASCALPKHDNGQKAVSAVSADTETPFLPGLEPTEV